MFCKKCGKQIPEKTMFCPFCGEKVTEKIDGSVSKSNQKSNFSFFKWGGIGLLLVITVLFAKNYSGKVPETKILESSIDNIAEETEAEDSLVGIWKCEQGKVTFTEDGRIMFEISGIVFGNGWLNYEIIDNSNIYISGGGLPVGMQITYEEDGDFLTLEIADVGITLEKET